VLSHEWGKPKATLGMELELGFSTFPMTTSSTPEGGSLIERLGISEKNRISRKNRGASQREGQTKWGEDFYRWTEKGKVAVQRAPKKPPRRAHPRQRCSAKRRGPSPRGKKKIENDIESERNCEKRCTRGSKRKGKPNQSDRLRKASKPRVREKSGPRNSGDRRDGLPNPSKFRPPADEPAWKKRMREAKGRGAEKKDCPTQLVRMREKKQTWSREKNYSLEKNAGMSDGPDHRELVSIRCGKG